MIADGIHFGLDEEAYHADPALGSSDLKRLLINPVGWWSGSAAGKAVLVGLGIMRADDEDEEESLSKQFGRASHVMVLEPERFDDCYLEHEEMPAEYLTTRKAIRDALLATPGAYVPIGSAQRPELVMAAKRAGLSVSDDWKIDEQIKAGGRSILSKRWVAQLRMIDYLMNAPQPALDGRSIREENFTGGYSEVSIFWTEQVGDATVRLKARIDYLRRPGMIDLKTYGCPEDKPPVSFFLGQIANYGYDLQKVAYTAAWKAAHTLRAEGRVFGQVDRTWLDQVKFSREPSWRWIACQTMRMPEIDWIDWNASLADMAAEGQRREALASFVAYRERFGMDTPWLALRGRIVADDTTLDATGIARRMMARGEQTWTASA